MHKPLEQYHEELHQLFIKACEDHQNGHLDMARVSYLKLIDYFAEVPVLHYNLGLVYYSAGNFVDARNAFGVAAELQPDDADILFNLALSQKKSGDPQGAIASYQKVLRLDPQSVDVLYNLAGCYKDVRQYEDAMATYLAVLRFAPQHLSANNNLAFLYHLIDNKDEAVRHYKKVLEINPTHPGALHMVAALTGERTTSSPERYVKEVFDNYSGYFEQSLVNELAYTAPTTIRGILDQHSTLPRRYDHGLDLGCGTGLGGQAFVDIVHVLDGIDLSDKMIALAAEKNIYAKLHVGNLLNFLSTTEETFDFFLAADVFAYIGDLEETFRLLGQKGRQAALCCFSTESIGEGDYTLQETGRFAHSAGYIRQLAKRTGWQVVAQQQTSLRKEKNQWVEGDLWFLTLIEQT